MDMYENLQRSFKKLRKEEKASIPKTQLQCDGFDGNSETELMAYAQFLREDMGRFDYLDVSSYNSHMPKAHTYRRMLGEMPDRKGETYGKLDAATITAILG